MVPTPEITERIALQELQSAIETAKAEKQLALLERIESGDHWQSAAWFLSRRWPAKYGDPMLGLKK